MNDERPIEKLLRRYAKKRGGEAGTPELHPATRRLLQGEVGRQFPKKPAGSEATSFGQVLKGWLPWLGWATVMVVVVGFGVLMFYGGSRTQMALAPAKSQPAKFELAKNDAMEAALGKKTIDEVQKELAVRNQPATPPPAPGDPSSTISEVPAPVLADRSVGRAEAANVSAIEKKSAADRSLDAPKPTAIAAGEITKAESAARTSGDKAGFAGGPAPAQKLGASDADARRAAAPPRVATTADALYTKAPTLARGGGLEPGRARSVEQTYSNAAPVPRYANTAKSAPVLVNFQVEQAGNQLRVIDSDGSTYSGEMPTPENFASATDDAKDTMKKRQKTVVPPGAAASTLAPGKLSATSQEQEQNYFYQVAGTNRTLNQQVVFTWNFVAPTNDAGARQFQGAAGALNKDGGKLPAQLPGSLINGRARLGTGREIEINATPVK